MSKVFEFRLFFGIPLIILFFYVGFREKISFMLFVLFILYFDIVYLLGKINEGEERTREEIENLKKELRDFRTSLVLQEYDEKNKYI